VKHNVTALENSTLMVTGGTIVGGSILADKSFDVEINNTTPGDANIVRRNIELRALTGGTAICGTTVTHGDILVEKMTGDHIVIGGTICGEGFGGPNIVEKGSITVQDNLAEGFAGLRINGNDVARNLRVFRNLGSGFKTVAGNTVGQTVQCLDNAEPFIGGPNIAPNAEGQCFVAAP
jgi:hypothetical protein